MDRMDPSTNRRHQIIALTERLLGDDRFGDAWTERTDPSRPVIGVAVVAPSQDDIDRIATAARDAGWPAHIVAVRYPAPN